MITKKCIVCDKLFEGDRRRTICGITCKKERKRILTRETYIRKCEGVVGNPKEKVCPECRLSFLSLKKKYCSDKCKTTAYERSIQEDFIWYNQATKEAGLLEFIGTLPEEKYILILSKNKKTVYEGLKKDITNLNIKKIEQFQYCKFLIVENDDKVELYENPY